MNKTHRYGLHIDRNSYVDGGEGIISFPNGQVISDNTKQRNGTVYDIESMDLSEYKGQVTADHTDQLDHYIGQALGLAKTDSAVTISGIRFAIKESAQGLLAYNLMTGGFPLDLSIETYGPWPDESDDMYHNAKLIGLSVVIVGNNKSATMGKAQMALVRNSIEQARTDGLDVADLEKIANEAEKPADPPPIVDEPAKVENKQEPAPVADPPLVPAKQELTPEPEPTPKAEEIIEPKKDEQPMFVTKKNARDFAIKVTYKNAAGDEVETELAPGSTLDVSEDQAEAVEKQINSAQAPQPDFKADIAAAVNAATAPIMEKLEKLESTRQEAFDKQATEPVFKREGTPAVRTDDTADAELNAMDYRERHALQIGLAWDGLKGNDRDAMDKLRKINVFNLNKLKSEGMVQNSLSIGDFGNFVISRELLTDIQGIRSDFSELINATEWKETLSTQMAWLERSGDIDMQPVAFLDDATSGTYANGNLKPISNYTSNIKTADLEELAAVTPVMNSATRFLAADLLGDVAAGYRNDYDRKRAQLIIARLEQAVEANGNAVSYNYSSSAGGNVQGLVNFLQVWTKIGNKTPNGTYIFGTSTFAELTARALTAGTNGPLSTFFTDGPNGIRLVFGRPYIVVPDELLPRLGTAETKAFVVNGTTVTVNSAVFYVNLSNFTGRTSGGLNYDLSMEAAYEDGGTVKSAFQRNEMVLRGSFFRGGAIKDSAQVSSLLSPGVS